MKKVGVALLGLGTVGGGTYRILVNNKSRIEEEYGISLEIIKIMERDKKKAEKLGVPLSVLTTDINDIISNPEINVVAEFFGGIEPAKTFLIQSLEAGKSIVTANKELFSKNWPELEMAAKKGNAGLYFEATCAGGVPVIRTLNDAMQANTITAIKGIINGTTNYILTKMSDEGADYGDVLKTAQKLGYAEANPEADVEGYDASYKLSILSTLAYKTAVPVNAVYREGITKITNADIEFGKEFGLTIKLLGISKKTDKGIEARVHPVFIPKTHPLSSVKGSFNAVYISGDAVDDIMLYGRGAGDLPTGSAIVSDIVYAGLSERHKRFPQVLRKDNCNFISDFESEYYIRLLVNDKPGVLASLSGILGEYDISITTMVQKEGENVVPLCFVTHKTCEKAIQNAVSEIKKLPDVIEVSNIIRVER